MDRFSLETASDLAGNYARNRFWDEVKPEPEPNYCVICDDNEAADEDGVCLYCQADAEERDRLADEMEELELRAFDALCLACGCTKKTVVSDRLMLGTKGSPCCGEAA